MQRSADPHFLAPSVSTAAATSVGIPNRAETAPARGQHRDDVAGLQVAAQLAFDAFAVDPVLAAAARRSTKGARRPALPALAQNRDRCRLEHTNRPDHPAATGV